MLFCFNKPHTIIAHKKMSQAYPHVIRASLIAAFVPAFIILLCMIALNIANLRDSMVPQMFLSVIFYGAIFYVAPILSIALIGLAYLLKYMHRLFFSFAYALSLLIFKVFLFALIIWGQFSVDEFFIAFMLFAVVSSITLALWFRLARATATSAP